MSNNIVGANYIKEFSKPLSQKSIVQRRRVEKQQACQKTAYHIALAVTFHHDEYTIALY